jgi:hypothetical protein
MNRMTVCVKGNRGVPIPLQEKFPQVRVLFSKNSQLVYPLIVTKPTPPPVLPWYKSEIVVLALHTTSGNRPLSIRFPLRAF